MLAESKLKTLLDYLGTLTQEEKIWVNGYISGVLSNGASTQQITVADSKPAVNKVTITYGTDTGNSKRLAVEFAAKAKKNGINAKVIGLDQYRLTDLVKEEYFLSLVSTHGDGEPPAAAKKFYDYIHQTDVKLNKLKYGVLALGDSSYPLFCVAGEEVDKQLEKLGGERIVDLQKCDIDYEQDANEWFNKVLQKFTSAGASATASVAAATTPATKPKGKKIYTGKVITNVNMNDLGSNKETHHIEITADGLEYLPGDAFGMIPENPASTVIEILTELGIEGTKTYTFNNHSSSIFELLKKKVNIIHLPERVVKKYAEIVKQDIPATRMDLLHLLKIYPLSSPDQFTDVLNILEHTAPRLYSISSSLQAHQDEVHLTVAKDTFCIDNEVKYGLCSDLLCATPKEAEVEFYIHKNNQFRLPNEDKDIIMIGPGTGIAPFRSFLAERDATGASGRNWLFFGDQHFVSDFLYQTEIQNWKETGVLTKVNVAFSRDQKEKVYVQHKMLKHGAELYDWLQSGAYVYVCGAKEPMSEDVENTLIEIIETHSNKSKEEAVLFMETLREEGRYLKDVY